MTATTKKPAGKGKKPPLLKREEIAGRSYDEVLTCELLDYGKPKEDGTFKQRYEITFKDGRIGIVRRVTTILGVLGKPALIQWAANKVCERLLTVFKETPSVLFANFEAEVEIARTWHDTEKKEAGKYGTTAHRIIEDFLRGDGWPTEKGMAELPPPVQNSLGLFRDWWEANDFVRVVAVERYVFNLGLNYGGTLDFLAMDKLGRTHLIDWKTSRGIYEDMLMQLAAYAAALKIAFGESIESATIVRIGKEDVLPQILTLTKKQLAEAFAGFAHCCKLYDTRSDLAKITEPSKKLHRAAEEVERALIAEREKPVETKDAKDILRRIKNEVRAVDLNLSTLLGDVQFSGVTGSDAMFVYPPGFKYHHDNTAKKIDRLGAAVRNVLGEEFRAVLLCDDGAEVVG